MGIRVNFSYLPSIYQNIQFMLKKGEHIEGIPAELEELLKASKEAATSSKH